MSHTLFKFLRTALPVSVSAAASALKAMAMQAYFMIWRRAACSNKQQSFPSDELLRQRDAADLVPHLCFLHNGLRLIPAAADLLQLRALRHPLEEEIIGHRSAVVGEEGATYVKLLMALDAFFIAAPTSFSLKGPRITDMSLAMKRNLSASSVPSTHCTFGLELSKSASKALSASTNSASSTKLSGTVLFKSAMTSAWRQRGSNLCVKSIALRS